MCNALSKTLGAFLQLGDFCRILFQQFCAFYILMCNLIEKFYILMNNYVLVLSQRKTQLFQRVEDELHRQCSQQKPH